MNNFNIKRAEYVEIQPPSTNTSTTLYFPDLPNLRTAKIEGMTTIIPALLSVGESGLTNAVIGAYQGIILNIYFENGVFIKIPALSLAVANGTAFHDAIVAFAGQTIVWPKSYIFIADSAQVAATQGKALIFNIFYSLQGTKR